MKTSRCSRWLHVALIGIASAACTTASVTGTVSGQGINVADVAYLVTQANGYEQIAVYLSEATGLCGQLQDGSFLENQNLLAVMLQSGSTNALGQYSYLGTGGSQLSAEFFSLTTQCQDVQGTVATDGTLSVTSNNANVLVGHFKLGFGRDALTGTFAANYCNLAWDDQPHQYTCYEQE